MFSLCVYVCTRAAGPDGLTDSKNRCVQGNATGTFFALGNSWEERQQVRTRKMFRVCSSVCQQSYQNCCYNFFSKFYCINFTVVYLCICLYIMIFIKFLGFLIDVLLKTALSSPYLQKLLKPTNHILYNAYHYQRKRKFLLLD